MSSDADPAETFQHTPLEENSIRLLRIRPGSDYDELECRLEHFALQDLPSYVAISYRWGNDVERMHISIDGLPFELMPNAYWALYYQRARSQKQFVWIDTLCIDQRATQEKNHQVGLMGQIFSGASEVFLWLGNSTAATKVAMTVLNQFEFLRKPVPEISLTGASREAVRRPFSFINGAERKMYYFRIFRSVLPLFAIDYWRRIWVMQEIVLATRLTLMCGDQIASWQSLESMMLLYKDDVLSESVAQLRATHTASFAFSTIDTIVTGLHRMRADMRRRKSANDIAAKRSALELTDLLDTYSKCQCADQRDKVYGLVGIWNTIATDPFLVDYSRSARDLLVATFAYIATRAEVHNYGKTFEVLRRTLGVDTTTLEFMEWEKTNCSFFVQENCWRHPSFSWLLDNGETTLVPLKLTEVWIADTISLLSCVIFTADDLYDYERWRQKLASALDDVSSGHVSITKAALRLLVKEISREVDIATMTFRFCLGESGWGLVEPSACLGDSICMLSSSDGPYCFMRLSQGRLIKGLAVWTHSFCWGPQA